MANDRKALCIGINNFENLPPRNTLQGCVNDANNMGLVLKQYLGFSDSDIVKLLDNQATKKNIMDNLTSMVQGAKEGKYKYIVVTLSSHGSQIPDESGDEYDDRYDEAFVPYDLKISDNRYDPNHIITDDELGELFSKLPQNVLLEAFFDTCHSGNGLRDILLDQSPRYLEPASYRSSDELRNRYAHPLHEALTDEGVVENTILWAACLSDQTSADANIGGGYNGAFTYNLVKQIRESNNQNKRSATLKAVRDGLKGVYTQIPKLECLTKFENMPLGYSP
jgi:hypothetical protein